MTPPPGPQAAPDPAPGWLVPGALVLRLMLVAALAVALSGAVAAWLVTRASGQEAMRRVVSQQTDEVEVVARLLASKIEQSQKVLRTVAAGITPAVLESPSSLEWLLQQGLPAVQFFDTMQVARDNGELRLNLRAGQIEKAADLDPAERDALRRTLVDGKPLVSELIAGRRGEARVMFTMPLHRDDGTVMGVVAGALRLQSQSLLPPSMTLPARDDSQLIVFTRAGTILSHSDPARVLGQVRDEAGLAPVYTRWQSQAQPVVGRGMTHVQADHIVSMAGMPLPQWIVARVSQSQALLAPLRGAQREAWWLAVASMVLCMLLAVALMGWMAQPLAQLTFKARQLLRTSARQQPAQAVDWPRAWLGYLLRIRPHLRHGRLVLGDRYLFNYFLDPQSVRYGASSFWIRLALRLVPKPDVVISLVAEPEVIHARKDELTVAEITERLARARELRSIGFNLVEVSAEAPLQTVVERAAEAILHCRA